jgi:hypothetical protein
MLTKASGLDGDTVGLITYVPRGVQIADEASAAIRKLIGWAEVFLMTTPLSGEGQQRPGSPRSDPPDSPSVESAFSIVIRAVWSLCGRGDRVIGRRSS